MGTRGFVSTDVYKAGQALKADIQGDSIRVRRASDFYCLGTIVHLIVYRW